MTCRNPNCTGTTEVSPKNAAYCCRACYDEHASILSALAICSHGYRRYECWACRQGTRLKRIAEHTLMARHAQLEMAVSALCGLDPWQIEDDLQRVYRHNIPPEQARKLAVLKYVRRIICDQVTGQTEEGKVGI